MSVLETREGFTAGTSRRRPTHSDRQQPDKAANETDHRGPQDLATYWKPEERLEESLTHRFLAVIFDQLFGIKVVELEP